MANNPYVNKVVFNNNTLIDLSSDTVTASKLAQGYTAHSASGAQITGTMPEGGGGEYDIEGTTLASGGQQLDITDAGGGSSITVEPITITTNGTTTAPTGKAYSPVTVNVSGGGNTVPKANIDSSGNLTRLTSLDVSNIVNVSANSLKHWQYGNTSLTGSLNFSRLTTIGNNGLSHAFYECSGLTGNASFPELTSIGLAGFEYTLNVCRNLTGVLFPKLTTVTTNGFYYAFRYCTGLTSVSFPALTSVESSSFYNAFLGCSNITELHFKASVQSAIEAATGYSSKFGATNATIYFDL